MDWPIIDTHLHLIYRDRLSYPWLADVAGARSRLSLRDATQTEARRCGVTDALHMEVDVAPDDIEAETRNVDALATAAGQPAARRDQLMPAGGRRLSRISRAPARQSVRQGIPPRPARRSGRGQRMARPFARTSSASPDRAVRSISASAPTRSTRRSRSPTSRPTSSSCSTIAACRRSRSAPSIRGASSIAEIARRPNVAVKISGVVAYADGATWTVDDIRPYVEHAIESFGWDRVVWGSDWPVCTLTASLSTWIAAIAGDHAGLRRPDERERLFSANARRIWRLPT